MKKVFLSIVLVLCLMVGIAKAGEIYSNYVSPYWIGSFTTSTTGAVASQSLYRVFTYIACQDVITGVTPTAIQLSFEGSLDNINFVTLATITSHTTNTYWSVVDKPIVYIRPNVTTWNTSTVAGTTLTINCVAAH